MITHSVCPICSGKSFKDFLVCKDYTTSGESFSLKQCNFCDFVLTDPQPDESSIGKYYQSDKYISHTGGSKSFVDLIYRFARKNAVVNKRRIIQKYSNGKSILDFGCGTGEFLEEMKSNHWQIFGVEPSSVANEKASTKIKSKIFNSISEIRDQKVDVITLWHVLEHLHDLNGSLKKFSESLNKSGTIFIAVPNLQSHDAKFYNSFWAAYDVPRHLWHFNKDNMKQLLENHNFKLIDILPMTLDSFYVSMLSESYKNPSQSKFLGLINAFIRGFLSNRKAKKNVNYSSLIYIAKR